MRQIYFCEVCDRKFDDLVECEQHEAQCNPKEIHTCDKCGKTEEWDKNDDWAFTHNEGWHRIDLGRLGYGSGLDGCDVEFNLCDDCLIQFINTFTLEGQEKVWNSGSNSYLPTDIWIREAKGKLTDEEYEEYGMYSPRQIKAYEERFPICNKVSIIEYKNGSRGSGCSFGAFGNDLGSTDINYCDECYECKMFQPRKEGEEIPITYDTRY